MMPPNFGFMNKLWAAAFESLYVAMWGTIFGVFSGAADSAFSRARNLSPHPACSIHARQVLNCMRGINESSSR